ncbi:MAG: alpha/beta hydrolase family protein [Clostridiaceae bacterium]
MAKISIKIESRILEEPNEIIVYVPKKIQKKMKSNEDERGVNKTTEPYKVLYLLHGKNGDANAFFDFTNVIAYAEKYGIITISTSVRNSFYTNMVYGEKYFDYLSIEVPETINSMLNLKIDPLHTYILGYSMGGFGALKMGLTYPDRFRGIASLSGSLRSMAENKRKIEDEDRRDLYLAFGDCEGSTAKENDIFQLLEKAMENEGKIPEIYLYCGRNDGLLEVNRTYHEYLEEKGISHIYVEDDGKHEFERWDEQIREYIKIIQSNEVQS